MGARAQEEPSDFFLEKACADPRVIYRFFPVTREAPASPRLCGLAGGVSSGRLAWSKVPSRTIQSCANARVQNLAAALVRTF